MNPRHIFLYYFPLPFRAPIHPTYCFRTIPNREHTVVRETPFSFSTPSMPNPVNITILDTSPIFQYLPSQDGPINTSWNASFSGSPDSTSVPQAFGVGVRSFLSYLTLPALFYL